ncbi:hypothetical protein GCM10010210_29850 [Pseudonocardia hydrocarbonoxydans]
MASLLFGFPIFFDAGFVVFLPIIFSVARRFGGSVLTYALPSAGAFAVMHAFVPPHPGPVGAAGILGADIGLVLVVGLVIGLPTWYVASYLFGLWSGRRDDVPVPELLSADGPAGGAVRTEVRTAPPRFSTVLALLLLPLVLILLNTGLNTLATAGVVDGDTTTVGALRLLGQTPVALLITVLVALVVLGRERFSRAEAESIVNSSLGPVCAIILITGAGGAFGGVLRTSGIGDALAQSLDAVGLPVIVAAFLIATALRVAQGSATVALTTTAGLVAPVVAAEALSGIDVALVVIAIAAGSTVLSHVNDSGFWLVGRFLGMDVRTTLRTWTVMETLIGLVGFALAFVASLVLESAGAGARWRGAQVRMGPCPYPALPLRPARPANPAGPPGDHPTIPTPRPGRSARYPASTVLRRRRTRTPPTRRRPRPPPRPRTRRPGPPRWAAPWPGGPGSGGGRRSPGTGTPTAARPPPRAAGCGC